MVVFAVRSLAFYPPTFAVFVGPPICWAAANPWRALFCLQASPMECRGRTQCTQATGAVPAANTTEPQQLLQPGILVIIIIIQHAEPLRQLRALVGPLLTEDDDPRLKPQPPKLRGELNKPDAALPQSFTMRFAATKGELLRSTWCGERTRKTSISH